jgi:hypothetical protein
MVDENKEVVAYKRDGKFQTAPTVECNFFVLSLFTRVSDHFIPYSTPCNHRHPVNENLLSRKLDKLSLVDQVYDGAQNVFSGNAVNVIFYQEKEIKDPDDLDFPGCKLTSIARETIKVGMKEAKEVKINFSKTASFPTHHQLLKLAFIMGVHIAPPTDRTKDSRLLDFTSSLSHFASYCNRVQPKNTQDLH